MQMDRPKNKSKKLNIDGSKMKGRKAESKRQKTKDKKQKNYCSFQGRHVSYMNFLESKDVSFMQIPHEFQQNQ